MKIRVLHVIDTGGPGGAETVLADIVQELPRHIEVHSRAIVPVRDWLADRLAELDCEVRVFQRRRSPDVVLLWRLVQEIRSFRPHVIHCHLLTSSVYTAAASVFAGRVPVIATIHGEPDIDPEDRALRVKSRLMSRGRNHVVFVAEHLREKLAPPLGLTEAQSSTVRNGRRFDDAKPFRRAAGSRGDPLLRVGCVGNIRAPKDYGTLLRAAHVVHRRLPNARFIVAGEGTDDSLLALRKSLDLEGVFEFAGFVSDVPEFIRELDVYTSSSRTEGLPLATVEAASMGVPVVATACGGNREVLDADAARYLVPVGDPQALGSMLLTALEDLETAQSIASKHALRVRERFSIDRMVSEYVDLYRRVWRA